MIALSASAMYLLLHTISNSNLCSTLSTTNGFSTHSFPGSVLIYSSIVDAYCGHPAMLLRQDPCLHLKGARLVSGRFDQLIQHGYPVGQFHRLCERNRGKLMVCFRKQCVQTTDLNSVVMFLSIRPRLCVVGRSSHCLFYSVLASWPWWRMNWTWVVPT